MIKLNLGCGFRKLDGFVNVDKFASCDPDMCVDLERFPWPFDDGSVDEVLLSHVLEHIGQDPNIFIGFMKELYRVCCDGAKILVVVPHPRYDSFLNDPTHVRPITPEILRLFSKSYNHWAVSQKLATTTIALYHDIDFEIVNAAYDLTEEWEKKRLDEQLAPEAVKFAIDTYYNVVATVMVVLKAVK